MAKISYDELLDIALHLGDAVFPIDPPSSNKYAMEIERFVPSHSAFTRLEAAMQRKGTRHRFRGALLDTGDVSQRRFFRQHFDGNGFLSLYSSRCLHDRLDIGLSAVSGINQGAPNAEALEADIRDVVRDVAVALTGYNIEFTEKVPEGGKSPWDVPDNDAGGDNDAGDCQGLFS